MAVLGVDVSAWQHQGGAPIPWTSWYAAGFRVAYVQATQGTGVQNAYFAQDVKDARAAGFRVGAYHFSYPSLNPNPANEFAYFTAYIAGTTLDLPPMLDDEEIGSLTFAELRTWVLAWLALAGPAALHYSDQNYLGNLDALGGLPYRQWTGRPGAAGLAAGDFATQYGMSPIGGSGPNVDQDYFDPSILGVRQEEEDMGYTYSWQDPSGQQNSVAVDGAGVAHQRFYINPTVTPNWDDLPMPGGAVAAVAGTVSGFVDSGGMRHIFALGVDGSELHWYQAAGAPTWNVQTVGAACAPVQVAAPGGLTTAQAGQLSAAVAAAVANGAALARIEAALKGA